MMRRDNVSRLGAIALVAGFVVLIGFLPERYKLAPQWLIYGNAAFCVSALALSMFAPGPIRRRVARPAALASLVLAIGLILLALGRIVEDLMYEPKTLNALSLFHTSVALWFGNILIFTIAYWLIDGGGPDARTAGTAQYFDFDFPARSEPSKLPPGWQPTIMDYLFVAFTANTSFGPTEAMPLTARAKALMIAQSFISLVTIAGVAARAIGATG